MLPREFADLGIAGLKSDWTVRAYRKAWQSASAWCGISLARRSGVSTGGNTWSEIIDRKRQAATATSWFEVVISYTTSLDVTGRPGGRTSSNRIRTTATGCLVCGRERANPRSRSRL